MSPQAPAPDLLVVGAGPAGVAAALMAASLKWRTTVVEAGLVGGKLHHIGALANVPGSWSAGPRLAEALALDLERLQKTGLCTVVHGRAVAVSAADDRGEVVLDDGRVLGARAVVVATGVATLTPADADWITAPPGCFPPPLWRTVPSEVSVPAYVIGGDRPLGTWLRAHPEVTATLHVLHPPSDDYKVAEVAEDARVRLLPVSHITLTQPTESGGWIVEVEDRRGQRKHFAASTVLTNLGNKPAALSGLSAGEDGHCPSELQHPRIRVAGDLRSARFQRIVTAHGSGAEAVLACYYAATLQRA